MAFVFEVKVIPSSGRNKWIIDSAGQLKCYLKSPPERGKANKELIKIIAKLLHISQKEVAIISGQMSRKKKIKVEQDMTYDLLLHKLGIERQLGLF